LHFPSAPFEEIDDDNDPKQIISGDLNLKTYERNQPCYFYLPTRDSFYAQAKSILLTCWSVPAPNRSTLPTHRPVLLRARTKYRNTTNRTRE